MHTLIHSDLTVQEAACMCSHHKRACVPAVILVFEFAACEGIPCGIVVFAPLLFQCVIVERYTVLWISASVWIPWSSLLFL